MDQKNQLYQKLEEPSWCLLCGTNYHVCGVKMKYYGNLQQWSIETHLLRQIEKHEQGTVRVLALRKKGIV